MHRLNVDIKTDEGMKVYEKQKSNENACWNYIA